MKRLVVLATALVATAVVGFVSFAPAALPPKRACTEAFSLCTEVVNPIGYAGEYTGHDEPSLLFYSDKQGSGNSNTYTLRLPRDSKVLPTQDGKGGTWNFQLHPAFWFGMALCDTQSSPEYTTTCTPNSDTNIKDDADPSSPNYIGKHAGTAFMEMQFYPPGWVAWAPGNSCDATKWCAALNIDSLSLDQNTNVVNNVDCLNRAGIEPVNFAFVTTSGAAHAPANPLDATLATYTPDPATDLFMNSGDKLRVDLSDSPHGFRVVIRDLTTGQTGSMTASPANGFAQVNFDPTASTCSATPYAFHPMYATSSEHTRVPWAAHSYNVAFSDEIGHFDYCNAVDSSTGACTAAGVNDPGGLDGDETYCFGPADSTLVKIGGCLDGDPEFDGVPYKNVWPGSRPSNRGEDGGGQHRKLQPEAIQFTSPLFNGHENYSRVAFETDLPRIEAADLGGKCDRSTGTDCVNPPPGADFYPIYTTRSKDAEESKGAEESDDRCMWQLGGANIKGTTNTFGGNSTAEYGPLLLLTYPAPGGPQTLYNDFRNVLSSNPCKA